MFVSKMNSYQFSEIEHYSCCNLDGMGCCNQPVIWADSNTGAAFCEAHIQAKDGYIKTEPEPSVIHALAQEVAKIVSQKQKAYGDSFGKSGEVLAILYPNGIPVDQYGTALCVVRIVDKLFRVATNGDPEGEDPFLDIAGYALLAMRDRK